MRLAFLLLLLGLPVSAGAQQAPWWYLDRVSTRCVPVDLAFPGSLTPQDVQAQLTANASGGPWRLEMKRTGQVNGAEIVDAHTGRRFHFFEIPAGCLGFRNLFFGR